MLRLRAARGHAPLHLSGATRRLKKLVRDMVRCQLPAPISDHRHLVLQHRAPCAALVFGHRTADHLREVHGIYRPPPGAFRSISVEARSDEGANADDE